MLDFKEIERQGNEIIYRESHIKKLPDVPFNFTWEYDSQRTTPNDQVFIYRTIVPKENAWEYWLWVIINEEEE